MNGINGLNGSSCSATQLETGAAIICSDGTSAVITNGQDGTDGRDGRTPQLRCNENKNRWEVRYSDEEQYTVLNNKSTPCKATI